MTSSRAVYHREGAAERFGRILFKNADVRLMTELASGVCTQLRISLLSNVTAGQSGFPLDSENDVLQLSPGLDYVGKYSLTTSDATTMLLGNL